MATVFYTDISGVRCRRRKTGFPTKREAKAWEEGFNKKNTAYSEMTIEDMWEEYKRLIFPDLSKNSIQSKEIIYRTIIAPYFSKRKLKDIEAKDIKEWHLMLRKKYKITTIRTFHKNFSAIFTFACKYYKFTINPLKLSGAPKREKNDDIEPTAFWTLEDYNIAMEYENKITNSRDRVKLLTIKILFWTGLRIGELLALTLNDILFNKKAVRINKTWSEREKEFGTPKTESSNRIVSLPDCVWEPLMEYLDHLYKLRPSNRIFLESCLSVRRFLTKICIETNVPVIHPHGLRHSHASLLIRNGISPIVIKDRLGHATINTTLNVYSHIYSNDRDIIADKLNKLSKVKATV